MQMRNIEIKARIGDIESAKRTAGSLCGGGPAALLHQVDTYFEVPAGRLKMREFDDCNTQSELIYYERSNVSGPRSSDYLIELISDSQGLKSVLEAALGVTVVVRKTRTLYLYENTRIHLDEVDGLGTFIEFEYVMPEEGSSADGEQTVRRLMRCFSIGEADLLEGSYSDMMMSGNPDGSA